MVTWEISSLKVFKKELPMTLFALQYKNLGSK